MIESNKIKTQKQYINLLLTNIQNSQDWIASPICDIEYFDFRFKHILNAIKTATSQSLLVTKRYYSQYVRKIIASKMQWIAQQTLFQSIIQLKIDQNDYLNIKNSIVQNYMAQKSAQFIQKFRLNSSKNGTIHATKVLLQGLQDIVSSIKSSQSKISFQDMYQVGQQFNKITQQRLTKGQQAYVKCYINQIDHITGKGFGPGTLTLFCADVSGFKSGMMLNVGINIWKYSKKNVLYVPLEMTRHQTYQRFISRQTKIKMSKINKPFLMTDQQRQIVKNYTNVYRKTCEDNNATFYVMQPSCRISVKSIQAQIKKHVQIFNPDVVIIDYIANLVPQDKKGNNGRLDKDVGDMLKSMRTMGKQNATTQKGFATISGAQVGRQALKRVRKAGKGKISFNSQDIRDSHQYAADSDNLFVQMYDPQNSNRLLLFAVKGRHGGTQFPDGSNMATLDLQRDICLVQSIDDNYFSKDNKVDILSALQKSNNIDFSKIDYQQSQQKNPIKQVEQKRKLSAPTVETDFSFI